MEKKSETQEAAPKKKPYNLREKKEKKAAYRSLIRAELADELYDKILNIVVVQKKYKDPNYSAKDLAKELKTNTRYLSAVVNSRFGMNYSCLLNEYRIKDALHLLVDKRYVIIYYGDNIPESPSQDWALDHWRARVDMAKMFVDCINRHGGKAQLVVLPKIGIKGNSHFLFAEKNNVVLADLLQKWIQENLSR